MLDLTQSHRRMVRNVFLNVEILLNDVVRSLSEYDVQAFAYLYYARAFLNTGFRAERERSAGHGGRLDCVVYEDESPRMLYEIKTFFKAHERLTREVFDRDIEKLASRLAKYPQAKGYLLVAGSREKFLSDQLGSHEFLAKHLHNHDKGWYPYPLKAIPGLRLRPSQKQFHGVSALITWEVKIAA